MVRPLLRIAFALPFVLMILLLADKHEGYTFTTRIAKAYHQFTFAKPQSVRIGGWLSDAHCASGRLAAGVYDKSNQLCAKSCAGRGQKIVLIDTPAKRILQIANQDAVKAYVGDTVEITGKLQLKTATLNVESVKQVAEEGMRQ